MRARIAVFGALGTLVTVLAAVAVFAPGVVERVGPLAGLAAVLDEVDRRQLLLLASVAVGLFVSAVSWRATRSARGERDAFDDATAGPPEDVTTARQRQTATGLQGEFDAAVRGDEDAADLVRDRLRETAARAYVRATDCDRDAARSAVREGDWTDDPIAAAALAGDDGPTYPLGSRLRLWLDPESERERRFDRTVRATAELAASDAIRVGRPVYGADGVGERAAVAGSEGSGR